MVINEDINNYVIKTPKLKQGRERVMEMLRQIFS